MACQGYQWSKWKTTSTIQATFIQVMLTKKVPGGLEAFLLMLFLEAHGNSWHHEYSASLLSQTCPLPRATTASGTAWMAPLSVCPARRAMPTWRSPKNPAWSRRQRKAHVSGRAWVFGCMHPCAPGCQCLRGCVHPSAEQGEAENQIISPFLVLWLLWENLDQGLWFHVCCFSCSFLTSTVGQVHRKFSVSKLFVWLNWYGIKDGILFN